MLKLSFEEALQIEPGDILKSDYNRFSKTEKLPEDIVVLRVVHGNSDFGVLFEVAMTSGEKKLLSALWFYRGN